jgi:hypothetical protein
MNLCLIRSYPGTGFPPCLVVDYVYVNGQMADEMGNLLEASWEETISLCTTKTCIFNIE